MVLYKLGGSVVLLCTFLVGLAAAFGYSPIEVMALKVSHVTVSGLTIAYALLLGIAIKILRNVISMEST